MANGWQAAFGNIRKGVQSLDLAGSTAKLTKDFSTLQQRVKEAAGGEHDVTELPEDYLALERRVDALRSAHANLLKITKAYEHETYDYPTQVNESITELSQNIGHSVSSWAAIAAQGTNLPQPAVLDKPPAQHKTLSHALSRAAANGAISLQDTQQSDAFAKALQTYAVAQDAVGAARLEQDDAIVRQANASWQAILTQINAAVKARGNVKSARLALDATRSRSKNSTGAKAEQSRLEIEQAEEVLVNATEEAITLMRGVLESPASLTALVALTKAQQAYHAKASETLASIIPDFEEAAVRRFTQGMLGLTDGRDMQTRAEGDYRKSRSG